MNKKALSPLLATVLLLVFALVIGTATMGWGKNFIEKKSLEQPKTTEPFDSAIIVSIRMIDTPLKELQIKYITDQITEEEYLEKEKQLLTRD